MNCKEFLKILDEDGPATQGPAGEHLDSCPTCRKSYQQWEAVRKELRRMKEEPSPPFLHTRVMAHVRSAGAVAVPRWTFFSWGRTAWAGPLLAAALLVLLGGYGLLTVLEPVRMTPAQKQAETARQIGEMKKDLPPVQGPSKSALDGEYREILEKTSPSAMEDEKNRKKEVADAMRDLPPLSAPSKAEAQKELNGVVAASEEADQPKEMETKGGEAKTERDALRSQAAYAPEPTPPAFTSIESNEEAGAKAQEAPKMKAAAGKPATSQQTTPAAPAPAAPSTAVPGTVKPGDKSTFEVPTVPTVMTPELEKPVKCKMEPMGGGETIFVTLQEINAPPAGTKIGVAVYEDGKIQIMGEKASRPKHLGKLYKAMQNAKLPPGKYALSRIVPQPE